MQKETQYNKQEFIRWVKMGIRIEQHNWIIRKEIKSLPLQLDFNENIIMCTSSIKTDLKEKSEDIPTIHYTRTIKFQTQS